MRSAFALFRFKNRRYLSTAPSGEDEEDDDEEEDADFEANCREKPPTRDRTSSSTRLQRKASFAPQLLAQDVDSKVNWYLDFIEKVDEIRYRESVNRLSSRLTIPFIILVASVGFARGIYFIESYVDALSSSGAIIVGLIILVLSFILFVVVLWAQIIMVYLPVAKGTYIYLMAEYIIHEAFDGGSQDILQILSALGPGLGLIAMVIQSDEGSEGGATSYYGSTSTRAIVGITQEQVFLTLFLPVCAQILGKGVRKSVVFASWIISMAIIAGCIFYLRQWIYLWDLVFGLIFLSMMYEHEKSLRSYFARLDMASRVDQRALKSSRKKVEFLQEEWQRQQQALAHAEMKRERAIAEMQRDQFRRVIGQVALDLKTPLQAIFMDLETLSELSKKDGSSSDNVVTVRRSGSEIGHHDNSRVVGGGTSSSTPIPMISLSSMQVSRQHSEKFQPSSLSSSLGDVPHGLLHHSISSGVSAAAAGGGGVSVSAMKPYATRDKRRASFAHAHGSLVSTSSGKRFESLSRHPSRGDNMTLSDIVTSLTASCNFLHMTVNRSMDFTKASSNIALVPSLAPFHLVTALTWPVTCMMQLQNASVVSLVPPASDISATVISDKHWVGENLLCLLVAAVKNGHGAPITVRVVISTPDAPTATQQPQKAVTTAALALVPRFAQSSISEDPSQPQGALSSSSSVATAGTGTGNEDVSTGANANAISAAAAGMFKSASGRIKLPSVFGSSGGGLDNSGSPPNAGKGKINRVSSFRVNFLGDNGSKSNTTTGKQGGSFRLGGFISADISFRPRSKESSLRTTGGGGGGAGGAKTAETSARQKSFRLITSMFKGDNVADEAKDFVANGMMNTTDRELITRRAASRRAKKGLGSSSSRTLLPPGSMVKIIVEDAGLGMSEKDKAEFFSDICAIRESVGVGVSNGDDLPTKMGRGLGPYIVQKRMEALSGDCGVSDRADGQTGTLYWFAFPYKPAISSSTAVVTHSNNTAPGAKAQTTSLNAVKEGGDEVDDHAAKRRRFTAQLNILLVDDSMTTLKVVRRTLMEQGHFVQTAKDGKQGLDAMLEAIRMVCLARSREVSTMLSDCSDDDCDGGELLAKIGSQMTREDSILQPSVQPSLQPASLPQQGAANLDITTAKRSVLVLPPIGGGGAGTMAIVSSAPVPIPAVVTMSLHHHHHHHQQPFAPTKIGDAPVTTVAAADGADRYLLRGRRVSTIPMMLPPEQISSIAHMSSEHSTRSSISTSSFDVVLMDLEMPIMSGVAAVKSLRQYEKEHRQNINRYSQLSGSRGPLVIVGISANSDSDSRLIAKQSGMDYFLAKPFSLADFQALLDEIYDDFSEYRDYGEEVMIAPSIVFPMPSLGVALSEKLATLELATSRSASSCSQSSTDSAPPPAGGGGSAKAALNALNSSHSSSSESSLSNAAGGAGSGGALATMVSRRNSRGEETDNEGGDDGW